MFEYSAGCMHMNICKKGVRNIGYATVYGIHI